MAGDGVTPIIAQNGIQIGYGATGSITRNSVVNHVYTCPTFPCDAATNILVFESNKVTVRGNQTAKAVIGIYLVRSDDSEVRNNRVSDTDVFDGIAVIGSRNHVHLNRILNSDEFAVSVEGNDNLIEKNVINEAPCGIFTSGTGNSLLANSIFNTELATCEPFTLFSKALSLDWRSRSAFSSGWSSETRPGRLSGTRREWFSERRHQRGNERTVGRCWLASLVGPVDGVDEDCDNLERQLPSWN